MRQLAAPCPDQPGETDNLTGAHGQIDVLELALTGGAADHQQRAGREVDRRQGRKLALIRCASHAFDQARAGFIDGRGRAHVLPVAQDGDGVGD